jgi:WhiB family transcriptional regulator, redox-sensing transcriptional regulator
LTLRLPVPEDDGATVIDLTVTPWREAAACLEVQDEVSFFPSKEDLVGIVKAKAVCATCPVADVCLSWSIETNQGEGIWGGHTPKERRKLRRRWLEETQKAS